jgi:hypothetical protein
MASREEIANAVAEVWSQVLGRGGFPPDADFFDAGGQSLDAARICMGLTRRLGPGVDVAMVFESRTAAVLADRLAAAAAAPVHGPRPPTLAEVGRGADGMVPPQIERRLRMEQRRPFAHRRVVAFAYRVRGQLNLAALQHAVTDLVERHPVLRSRFVADQDSFRFEELDPAAVAVHVDPLPPGREGTLDAALLDRAREIAAVPFDLWQGPLFRVAVVLAGPGDAVLVITGHHYGYDDWSHFVVTKDLSVLYAARRTGVPPDLPALDHRYADFVHWQRVLLAGPCRTTLDGFWREYLAGAQRTVNMPGLCAPPDGGYRPPGSLTEQRIPAEMADRLRAFAAENDQTLFSLLLAGALTAIHALGGPADLSAHTSAANRRMPEFENLVGWFSHGLLIRSVLDNESAAGTAFAKVQRSTAKAMQHQDLPYSELVRMLWPEDFTRPPDRQTIYFDVFRPDRRALELDGALVSPFTLPMTQSDPGLNFFALDHGAGGPLAIQLLHNDDAVADDLPATLLTAWRDVLSAVCVAPERQLGTLARQVRDLVDGGER